MPRPEEKKKLFVDDQVLCDLFERLAEVTEPAKVNFRFVLGLILMRKRLIVYETTRHDDGKDVWVVGGGDLAGKLAGEERRPGEPSGLGMKPGALAGGSPGIAGRRQPSGDHAGQDIAASAD